MKITVETNVAAPIEQVWSAYTTPADIKKWNAASADWHTPTATVDLREGGKFSSRMEAKDGSMGFDFAGTYTKIIKHKLIEYSFGDRAARVEFAPGPKGSLRARHLRQRADASDRTAAAGMAVDPRQFRAPCRGKVAPGLIVAACDGAALPVLPRPLRGGNRILQGKAGRRSPHADALQGQSRKARPRQGAKRFDQRIMHACVRIAGAELFMSDGMRSGPTDFDCVSLSLNLPTEAEADRIFNALAADGKVTMPIGKTFFAQRFGGVTDRFGVQWMVIVQPLTG